MKKLFYFYYCERDNEGKLSTYDLGRIQRYNWASEFEKDTMYFILTNGYGILVVASNPFERKTIKLIRKTNSRPTVLGIFKETVKEIDNTCQTTDDKRLLGYYGGMSLISRSHGFEANPWIGGVNYIAKKERRFWE